MISTAHQKFSLYDDEQLFDQINRQRKFAWNLEGNLPWSAGIDQSKWVIPLDERNLFFPHISIEQKRALSQFLGLLINATISEMEMAILLLKDISWAGILKKHSVNPEMWELGELFFQEEQKHSLAFEKYNLTFANELGIDFGELKLLLPQILGSSFLESISKNSRNGGHACWWIVAAVEEVSIKVFESLKQTKSTIDPLFYEVHRLHTEEETRHQNYAFLMLDIAQNRIDSPNRFWHKKTDFIYGQFYCMSWMLSELTRFYTVKKLRDHHPFFKILYSILPYMEKKNPYVFFKYLFSDCPYISWVLNIQHTPKTRQWIEKTNPWQLPLPKIKVL